MEISGKMPADIAAIGVKRNKAQDGKTAYVDLEIAVEENKAEKLFGAEFKKLAFSTMEVREDPTGAKGYSFLMDTIKPTSRIVFARHQIKIAEETLNEQPKLLSIDPCDGAPRVIATFRIPVPVTKGALATLAKSVGTTTDVHFTVESPKMGFELKKGGKSAEDEPEAAEG